MDIKQFLKLRICNAAPPPPRWGWNSRLMNPTLLTVRDHRANDSTIYACQKLAFNVKRRQTDLKNNRSFQVHCVNLDKN